MNIEYRRKQYLVASLFLATVMAAFMVVPVQAWPSWPPGTYIGYAEEGVDMTPNSYYDYYGTFNESGERVWFHWEEESFEWTHTSHFFAVWVWVDNDLDAAIAIFRNVYTHSNQWGIMVNEGEEGEDEVFGTYQYTSSGSYVYWDGDYIAVSIYCWAGSGDFHVRIFVTDS